MRRLIIVFLCLALIASPVSAKHNKNLFGYDESTLRYWQSRYRSSMPKVLDLLLKTGMTSTNRANLNDVTFNLPLDAQDLPASYDVGEPFVFFVREGSRVITMSITSVMFLDELSKAAAWLYSEGCTFDPLADYMAMLQYRNPQYFGGHYPTPLQALAIPTETFNDEDSVQTEVEDLALSFFNEARVFIIAHELGHIESLEKNKTGCREVAE